MSHAISAVKFNDSAILFYEFNGTASAVCPKLSATQDEAHENWREEQADDDCLCGNDEPVRMMTTYGGGFSWDGRACRRCKAVTGGFMPFDEDENNYEDGLPDWSPWKKDKDGIA